MGGLRDARSTLLHLPVAFALAVAQPLLDLLGRYPEFLVAHQLQAPQISLLLGFLCLAIPLLLAFCSWASQRWLGPLLHLSLLALLLFGLALQGAKRIPLPPWIQLVGALAAALLLTFFYARSPHLRSVFTLLTPSLLLFPLLFLSNSQIWKLLEESQEGEPQYAEIEASQPVVFLVFDELPLISLLDEQRRIDPVRFPHLARLAAQSYWFRNATTVSEGTLISVPAILDALYPTPENPRLPTLRDHPRNLFTLLGGEYRLLCYENGTQLCPTLQRPSLFPQMSALASDLTVVFLHLLLPSSWANASLPPITQSWRDFRQQQLEARKSQERVTWRDFRIDWIGRDRKFQTFLQNIQASRDPVLYFFHSMLPHASWRYLPSGQQYVLGEEPGVPGVIGPNSAGLDVNLWLDEPWLVTQAYQRHLLQVGFVDTLVGHLVERLKEVNLFDRCLLVLTSDHGASFQTNTSRRSVTVSNHPEIMSIPLIMKAPGQREGVVVDRNVESIDILPTLAHLLGISLPWPVDGQSALDPALPERPLKTIYSDKGEKFTFPPTLPEQERFLRRKLELFGSGSWERLYRIGPYPELVGRPLEGLRVGEPSSLRVEMDGLSFLENVELDSPFLLTNLTGRVVGASQVGPWRLAVGINGILAAFTQTTRLRGIDEFSALISPHLLRPGRNSVQVFQLGEDEQGPVLFPILSRQFQFHRLLTRQEELLLVSDQGHSLPVDDEKVTGWVVSTRERNRIRIGGWAADLQEQIPAARVLVFREGELLAATVPLRRRPEIARQYENDRLLRSGFLLEFPLHEFEDPQAAEIRLVALSQRGTAGELHYPPPGSPNWHFRLPGPTPPPSPAEAKPYRWGENLSFGRKGTARPYLREGWSELEESINWTDGNRASLLLPLAEPAAGADLVLTLRLNPFLAPEVPRQRVLIQVNGHAAGEWTLTEAGFQEQRLVLPAQLLAGGPELLLTFELPDAVSPAQAEVNPDRRRLGVALLTLRLDREE